MDVFQTGGFQTRVLSGTLVRKNQLYKKNKQTIISVEQSNSFYITHLKVHVVVVVVVVVALSIGILIAGRFVLTQTHTVQYQQIDVRVNWVTLYGYQHTLNIRIEDVFYMIKYTVLYNIKYNIGISDVLIRCCQYVLKYIELNTVYSTSVIGTTDVFNQIWSYRIYIVM